MVFGCKLHFKALRSVQLLTPILLFSNLGPQIIVPQKSVAMLEKASTIEAKIQSFIPGKLIVVSASESKAAVGRRSLHPVPPVYGSAWKLYSYDSADHRVTTRHRYVSVACLYHTYCITAILPLNARTGVYVHLCFAAHGAYELHFFALLMTPCLFAVLCRVCVCVGGDLTDCLGFASVCRAP